MPPLPSDLRRVLENAVIEARDEATTAASAALKRLAVAAKDLPPYLTPDERSLRLKLRAAARQLGDPWIAEKQAFSSLTKITHEVAYEHWHRMLFARFLAENNLLVHPEHNVPVDLSTVAELAQEEAAKTGTKADTWAMAGRFAAGMLPQIFRPDDPALAVLLAPEHQQAMEKILESLPPTTFTADDSLGWVYQFWQSTEKDRVNSGVKAGDKITGETLPAVTQLFTEHYMVLFLLHNTVGAWWAGKQISKLPNGKAESWASEAEARAAVALPGYSFEYLRFVKDESRGTWRPAAGMFEGWPNETSELTVLDPCCGSGHFLVAALELLTHLRVFEEGLSAKEAAAAVIADSLFGLELDSRCTQIAAFNVALAAWKLSGEHFPIADMHIACAGVSPSASLEQWLKLADKNSMAWTGIPNHARQSVTNGLSNLHRLFSQAPELGSLIDPAQLGAGGELFSADWETLKPFLATALSSEKDEDAHERAAAAQGMANAAEILSGQYTLVVTNVPYLGRKSHGPDLKSWAERTCPVAKADLSTIFVWRILRWLNDKATLSIVTPQNWLFLTGYTEMRVELLRTTSWGVVANLGEEAWASFGNRGPRTSLLVLTKGAASPAHVVFTIDVSSSRSEAIIPLETKACILKGDSPTDERGAVRRFERVLLQSSFQGNPDSAVILAERDSTPLLAAHAACYQGISTGDSPRFICQMWELGIPHAAWRHLQGPPTSSGLFSGCDAVIQTVATDSEVATGAVRGREAWNRLGVGVAQTGFVRPSAYLGHFFPNSIPVIIPANPKDLAAIMAFCESGEYETAIRQTNSKVAVDNGYVTKVPFDLARWQKMAVEKYPNGLPEPQSDDPTQWLFHGHPAGRVPLTPSPGPHAGSVLQVAVARLAGYKWPAELDAKMSLAPEAKAWVEKCKDLDKFADDDGVVPLVPINKEQPGAERVRSLLEVAFGPSWSPGLLNDLLADAGSPGKSLDEWMKHEFFAQHCALFHQRPFVWQIWDGKKDGFNILVHYHRLAAGDGQGHKLLTKITYTYLGDWIAQQQAAAKRGEPGADTRLKSAQDLQKKLEAILAGEPPYDIFVRWKPLHEQPIGWNPDINDGVRMNIRPFVTAGVLRGKVNVKWTKDRGKEPESIRPKAQFPWFWSCLEDDPPTDFAALPGAKFTGVRLNDLHFTGRAKQEARKQAEKEGFVLVGDASSAPGASPQN